MSRLLDCGWTGPNKLMTLADLNKKITERMPRCCFESTLKFYNFKGTYEEEDDFIDFIYSKDDKKVQILLKKIQELEYEISNLKK